MNFVIVGGTTLPVRCAEILLEEGHRIRAFVSDDADVVAWADRAGISVFEPGDPDLVGQLAGLGIDWLLSTNNLWVIPDDVLRTASAGAVNFHDAPLPRYSGLNAPTWGIIEGAASWHVTWHLIEGRVDEGNVLLTRQVEVEPDDTSVTRNTRCYEAAIESFPTLVRGLADGTLDETEQDLSQRVVYGRDRRPAAAGVLRWQQPAAELKRLVQALDFGAYENPLSLPKLLCPGSALVVTRLVIGATESLAAPGTVMSVGDDRIEVAVADGSVILSGLRTQSGAPFDPASSDPELLAPGTVLPHVSNAEADALTAYHEAIARFENGWVASLRESSPLTLPSIDVAGRRGVPRKTGTTQKLPEALTQQLSARAGTGASGADLTIGMLAVFLARISGNSRFDLAYHDGADPASPGRDKRIFEEHVPLSVPVESSRSALEGIDAVARVVAELRTRRTHARDLAARASVQGADSFPIAVQSAPARGDLSVGEAALTLVVRADGRALDWLVDPVRMDPDDALALREQLAAFVKDLASDPTRPLDRVSALAPTDLNLYRSWNATQVDYEADVLIHELVARQAKLSPDRLAVACRGVELTYGELERRAEQMAGRLRARGVTRGTRVGVCMERSADLLVTLLGVLKAGGAYVPLDPTYPAERIAFMIEDSSPVVVASDAVSAGLLADSDRVMVVGDTSTENGPTSAVAGDEGESGDLAYVIYTSGSTGRPKGVMVSHRNVVNFFAGMDAHVRHDTPGTFLAVTSMSFDISVLELFWTLTRGFTVVVHAGDALVDLARRALDFSLFFFASDDASQSRERYRLLMEAARFGDTHGFSAVWTPERHFHAFGGLFPNPSVASAVIAGITERIHIRAGSVVAPLHNPVRIAEEWAFVDNISNGRVGISFASGWQPDDFVLAPDNFGARKEVMFEHIDLVHRLWRGESVALPGPGGREVTIEILPRPVQESLPTWVTAAGNPETFRAAGATGFGILTHLLGQTIGELGAKIAVYREARRDAGLDPDGGHVVLMLHAFVGDDPDAVREAVREPLKAYLKSSVDLIQRAAWTFPTFRERAGQDTGAVPLDALSEEELDEVLELSFGRYFETSGLLGTPDHCLALAEELRGVGVDEIACLIDFHGDTDVELAALPQLDRVRAQIQARSADTESIPSLIERYGVTQMQCTPSLAAILVQSDAGRAALKVLDQLLVGGEAFPLELAKTLTEVVDGDVLNMYGPTETTIWSTVYRVDEGSDGSVPIGRPIANTKLYVLDEAMQPVPIGSSGELYIGGDGVVPGYFDRSGLTAERFVVDPEDATARIYRTGDLVRFRRDGNLEFLGRIDHQVKIRGYRVEIGEIETVLSAHAAVRDVVVVARGAIDEGRSLAAYVTPANGENLSGETLRAYLRGRLPEFMIPQRFEVLEALPQTPNGKIDRAALPEPGTTERRAEPVSAPASDAVERLLTEIWRAELDLPTVGRDDNFFDLGGHSLLAVRIFTKIESRLGVRLPLASLLRAPTIAELAATVRAQAEPSVLAGLDEGVPDVTVGTSGDDWRALVPIRPQGDQTPLFLVHAHGGNVLFYYDLVRRLDRSLPVFALQAQGVDGVLEPLDNFEDMAARYVREVTAVQPHGPYRLGGDCLGGVLAYEMAQQLTRAGERVELVAMVDSFHPEYRPHVPTSVYEFVHQVRKAAELHVPAVRRLPRGSRWQYVRMKGAAAGQLMADQLPFGSHPPVGDQALSRTRAALGRAFDKYRPAPYDGRVLLFRSRRQPWGIAKDPLLGWDDLIPRLETLELDSYFQCGVVEPRVAELANELDEQLRGEGPDSNRGDGR